MFQKVNKIGLIVMCCISIMCSSDIRIYTHLCKQTATTHRSLFCLNSCCTDVCKDQSGLLGAVASCCSTSLEVLQLDTFYYEKIEVGCQRPHLFFLFNSITYCVVGLNKIFLIGACFFNAAAVHVVPLFIRLQFLLI